MTPVPDADASDAPEAADTEAWDDDVPTRHHALHLPLSPPGAERVRPVTIVAVLASSAALLLGALGGFGSMLAVTLVLSLLLAWAWPGLGGSYTPDATAVVLAVAAVAIVLTALREDLRWTASAVALGIVLSFMAQLVRRTGREGLVLTLLAAFGGLVPIASATTAVGAADHAQGRAYIVVAMASTGAAVVADLLTRRRGLTPFLGLVALVAAVAGAVVAALVLDEFGPWAALGVGAAVGSLSWSFRRVLAMQPGMITVRGQVAAGVGSVLLTGAVVHLFTLVS